MRKSKYTESQIMSALKQAESDIAFNDVCRQLGVSSVTFYKWKAKYGGLPRLNCRASAGLKKIVDSSWYTPISVRVHTRWKRC